MKKIIVLAFMCSLSFAAAGQDVAAGQPTVTLQDCISRGLENNFSIRMVKNRQQVSDNNASPANAGLLPTVDLSASYGGDFHTSRSTSRSTGITSTEKNAYDGTLDVGVDLNWTVFDGFSVWTNYKQLKLMKEQGELETRLAVEDYVASVITEYYNFIQQKIRLENFRKNMELSRERFRNVGISYSIGSYSLVDYLQAKVYFNVDSTQYMKQLEALNTSRITLNELLSNDDVTAYLNIHDTLIDVNSSLQYEELWRATLATNSQLLLADNNSAVVQAEYKKIMSRDYPYVRLNLGYGYTQNRYELAATRKRDNWGLSAGVTLGFNIFDGKRRMQRDNARLDIEYANLERENLKLSLKASLNNYWQAYKNNLQILMKERENHEAAVANYELSNLRWSEGQLSGFELREAQNSLLESEESILAAEYDTKMCEVSLMLLAGRVMEYLAGN